MKKTIYRTISGLAFLLLIGCAPVKFYSNPELTIGTGFKYYTVKPFLLVEKDCENGRIVNATVIYMPDLANPQYLQIKGGLGSKKVELKLTDGAINTLSLAYDPKVAETVEAMANLISKGASAVTGISALKSPPQAGILATYTELYEVFMENGTTTLRKTDFK
jgi:hypothetical protein